MIFCFCSSFVGDSGLLGCVAMTLSFLPFWRYMGKHCHSDTFQMTWILVLNFVTNIEILRILKVLHFITFYINVIVYVEIFGYLFRDSWDFNWKSWEFPFIVVKFTDNLSVLYSCTLQPVWDTVISLIYYKKKAEHEHLEFLKYSVID